MYRGKHDCNVSRGLNLQRVNSSIKLVATISCDLTPISANSLDMCSM